MAAVRVVGGRTGCTRNAGSHLGGYRSARILILTAFWLLACEESSFQKRETLQIDSVTPAIVSARGGSSVVLHGSGFGQRARVTVRGESVRILAHAEDAITFEMPSMVAGPASVSLHTDVAEVKAAQAIEVIPIPVSFSLTDPSKLPTLPAPISALVEWPIDDALPVVLAGTDAGLFALQWNPEGRLEQRADLIPEAGPAVRAIARNAEEGIVALCRADEAAPIQFIAGNLELQTNLVDSPTSCRRLAFVRVDATEPMGLIAETDNGLVIWRRDADRYVRLTDALPALPGAITSLRPVDLDNDGVDEVILSGTSAGGPWIAALHLGATPELKQPLPAPTGVVHAFAWFDTNGDEVEDLFVSGEGQDTIYLSDGLGGFSADPMRRIPFERTLGNDVALSDFDLDGKADLVIATDDGPDRLFLSSGDVYLDRTPLLGLSEPYGTTSLLVLDLDGDGDKDVLSVTRTEGLRLRQLQEPTP